MAIELRHLRSFVAVAEEGKIGGAADRLFITQPALSRQIKQLEAEVGLTLLLRGPHGVGLTEAGREFLDKARVAIEAVDEAVAIGRGTQPHGRLLIGHPIAGGRQRWFALTQAFANEHPGVEVEIREAISGQLLRQVVGRELDCALALAPERLDSITYTQLSELPLSVWLHRDHELAGRSEIELAELDGREIVLLGTTASRGSAFNAAIRGIFEGTDVAPRFVSTDEVFPPTAALQPNYLTVSIALDFPDGVVRVPLVPTMSLPLYFVQRDETNRATVRAYLRFAAEYFATR